MTKSLEEQIKTYREIASTIQTLEVEKKALGAAIMEQMQGKTMQVNQYIVRRIERLSISVPIDVARSLNAIKMEEAVDKDKIKVLYQSGQDVPGVSEIKYIQISEKSV